MAKTGEEKTSTGLESVMRAVVALLADEREARVANNRDARKTEELLADAGFSIGEIASLLGKPYEAIFDEFGHYGNRIAPRQAVRNRKEHAASRTQQVEGGRRHWTHKRNWSA